MTIGLLSCSLMHQQPGYQPGFSRWVKGNASVPVIAILPFGNRTDHHDLPELVRSAFYSHFSPLPYRDVEMNTIDATLTSLEKCEGKPYQALSSQRLGELLGCQALVYGDVTKFTRIYAGLYSQVGIGAEIKMIEVSEGRTVWTDSFTTRFHEGGIPLTHVNAALSLLKSSLNLRSTQELRAIDDLCRNLVARIPKVRFLSEEVKSAGLCELQVAAFKDLTRAQSLQRRLKNKKYAVFVRSVEEGGVTWHRVLLGPFYSGRDAEVWKDKIAAEFGITPVVLQNEIATYPHNVETRKEKD